jgi:ATP-dependent DNA helicase RecG
VSIDAFESTLKRALPQGIAYGVLHGRMADEEKDDVMKRFRHNDIQVLLSTSVIEVGMDVPNATMMVIVNADRFGLSQLHQMRGRVGRGRHASQACFVVDDPEKAKERLQILLDTDDGFKISEADLRLRGPGEVFGLTQSGVPRFMMADLMEDAALFDKAQMDAAWVFGSTDPKAKTLKKHAMNRADGFHLD